MKQNKSTKSTSRKFIFLTVMLSLFAFTQQAQAQCNYVVQNNSDKISQSIPEDFPVYKSTGDKAADDAAYQSEFSTWRSNHPEVPLAFFGPMVPGTAYIEIPKTVYDGYSAARKEAIDKNPDYYKVLN